MTPLLDIFQKHDIDEDVLLHALLASLVNERTAKDELMFFCATPVQQWTAGPDGYLYGELLQYAQEAVKLGNALHKLGEHLLETCHRHRLYHSGYLPYEYRQRFGRDLVLHRLMVPEITSPKYKTPDRFDQEDFYHRLELRR